MNLVYLAGCGHNRAEVEKGNLGAATCYDRRRIIGRLRERRSIQCC